MGESCEAKSTRIHGKVRSTKETRLHQRNLSVATIQTLSVCVSVTASGCCLYYWERVPGDAAEPSVCCAIRIEPGLFRISAEIDARGQMRVALTVSQNLDLHGNDSCAVIVGRTGRKDTDFDEDGLQHSGNWDRSVQCES